MNICQNQRCVVEFLKAEVQPINTHNRLVNVRGGETVDVCTVRRWICRFQSGDRDVSDKPRSGRLSTATNEENESCLHDLIKSNRRIKARFHYERGKKHSLFVLLIFFCARFNRRSTKKTKNALFHARSGNGP